MTVPRYSRVNESGLIVEGGDCWMSVSRPAVPRSGDPLEDWADYLLYRQHNTPGWVELSPSSVAALRGAITTYTASEERR